MARRLSAFADLGRYVIPDVPRWRSYRYQDVSLYAKAYEDALNLGDPGGLAYEGVARSRDMPDDELAVLRASSSDAADALASELATLDLADSTLMTATDANGRLRSAGKQEMKAVDALERDATDTASTQGISAALAKISAATLLETRQKQDRLQFLTAADRATRGRQQALPRYKVAVLNMQLARRARRPGAARLSGLLSGCRSVASLASTLKSTMHRPLARPHRHDSTRAISALLTTCEPEFLRFGYPMFVAFATILSSGRASR